MCWLGIGNAKRHLGCRHPRAYRAISRTTSLFAPRTAINELRFRPAPAPALDARRGGDLSPERGVLTREARREPASPRELRREPDSDVEGRREPERGVVTSELRREPASAVEGRGASAGLAASRAASEVTWLGLGLGLG